MMISVALFGGLLGWLLLRLSDYLLRFAGADRPTTLPHPAGLAPAAWVWLAAHWQSAPENRRLGLEVVVEVASAVFVVWAWSVYGISQQTALIVGGYGFFLLIALMDMKYRLVLNVLTYPAIALLLVGHFALNPRYFPNVVIGGLLAFSIFYLVARLKPGDVGGGDIKLAALIGFAFGFPHMLWALILGAGTGAVVALVMLVRQQSDNKAYIPYAPFLCLGALVALLVTV
ncbi:MAG: prepilin peptidase [Anaerolineaceae bacterium]|nr:prepilin peptidase [Anaerolineaceae bacterium]